MAVRKNPAGGWICEIYPNGAKGKRIRRKFATKGEALAFEQHTIHKPWQEEKEDRRTLKELIDAWYSAHGITLKDGLKRQLSMHHAFECMGEPLARDFDAQMFSRYREKRLKGEYARSNRVKEVSPRTLNLELAYFRAVFNELNRLGEWKEENPLKNMRPFRTEEMEMAWLTQDQIALLLGECKRHEHQDLETVVKICLATGARWSEAESLKKASLQNTKSRTPTRRAEETELYQSAKLSTSHFLVIKKVGYLVIVMVLFGQHWKELALSFRQGS